MLVVYGPRVGSDLLTWYLVPMKFSRSWPSFSNSGHSVALSCVLMTDDSWDSANPGQGQIPKSAIWN